MAHSLEHDGLTGLYTIQKFSQCVKRNLENNQDTKFTFIRLDIERFKMINNFYGVEAGARYYFDKSVQDLSIAECAYLAGLNHSPNSYNPFGDKDNSDKIEKRTKIVLSQMLDQKYISKEDYEKAVQEVEKGLKFKNGNIESSDDAYSYHTDALITEIIADLKDKDVDLIVANYSLPFCNNEQINDVWRNIVNNIKTKGYFVGNFFGMNDSWNGVESNMTFLTKEQVLDLFEEFDVIKFKEIEKDGLTGLGNMKHWHIFNIIAKKK